MSPRGRHEAGRPGDEGGEGFEEFRRDAFTESTMNDQLAEELLIQIVMIEGVIAARWPRRILVRARLRKDLRDSVRHVDGATFTDRRINTLGTGWLERRP